MGAVEAHEPFDIPDVLPLLPVRDLVVFPTQVVPLFVSREISLAAVEQALARDRLVFVVAQKDASEDAPSFDSSPRYARGRLRTNGNARSSPPVNGPDARSSASVTRVSHLTLLVP